MLGVQVQVVQEQTTQVLQQITALERVPETTSTQRLAMEPTRIKRAFLHH